MIDPHEIERGRGVHAAGGVEQTLRGAHPRRDRGERAVTITVPTPFNAAAMLRLVVRTEVNVCLGDADATLLADLHAIAQRELESYSNRGNRSPVRRP